ncbi:MAG: phosphatidate cytidylyltransferase [Thermoanaerobaculia bacterium]
MKRVLTAAIGIPLALWAVFRLPATWFLLLILVIAELAVVEYVRLAQTWTSKRVLAFLYVAVPLVTASLMPWWVLDHSSLWLSADFVAVARLIGFSGLICIAIVAASWILLARIPVKDAMGALGSLCFGVPYLVLPAVSLCYLQATDPWLLLLLLAVVWAGDSAAFVVGSKLGKHKLAPTISPNKSWEGAVASLVGALAAALVWREFYSAKTGLALLILVAVTGVVAQLGDLVESMLKRGAGVKDSGTLLPGHGGILDRFDALFFAAPVFGVGVYVIALLEDVS